MSRERCTHTLTVMVEPKEGAWHAWCPVLLDQGAATWGATREEALGHICEMVAMVVGRMAKEGVPIPMNGGAVHPSAAPAPPPAEQVVVTVRIPAA